MSPRRALVTGAAGRIGQAVVAELAAHGWSVTGADRVAAPPAPVPPSPGAAAFVQLDVGDAGQVAWAMQGCEAVVHLAAIARPGGHPDEVVFGNNTRATFAVLQAASLQGVRRAVVASSLSAL